MFERYVRRYAPHDVIFREGESGQDFYVVLDGEVGLHKTSAGERRALHRLGPGRLFGELAVIHAGPRAAEAAAMESGATVMAVDQARFVYLVSQQPGFALFVMETLARWLGAPERGTGDGATAQLSRPAALPCEAVQVADRVWQIRSRARSCNAYLLRGDRHVAIVDPGLVSNFAHVARCLAEIGVPVEEIDTVLLTHEHADHALATPLMSRARRIGAHPLAAHRLKLRDDFAMMTGGFAERGRPFEVNWTLDEGVAVDLGGLVLRTLFTPGHTSTSLSFFEPEARLLISGDLVMAGGAFGGVFGSGNLSDALWSLGRLRALDAAVTLPGHGPLSRTVAQDLDVAQARCLALLEDSRAIFEALDAQDNLNRIIVAARDLNRV